MNIFKRIGLSLLLLLAMVATVPAQTDSIQNEKPKSKISYYHALGMDYVLCPGAIEYDNQKYYDMGFRLHVLNGIQFNPWLILSLDFQFAYTHCHDEEWTIPVPMKSLSKGAFRHFENLGFKLGLDFRYRWFNRFKWSPIIGVTGGPSIELTSYNEYSGRSYIGWGGYLSEYFGCSYRYLNDKQLWFGFGWGADYGYQNSYLIGIEGLFSFKFEIQL